MNTATLLTIILTLVLAASWDLYCLRDLARADIVYRLPPQVWAALIIVTTPLGGLAYLTLGRTP